ncbi:extracellular solute-binding protein [Meiothermus sp. QL-1]|uniref:ABC transporter substrate-binding protein n=1 Tax=Meiothermus sp. QL-1 TaxID=2058095 RepID=UPI000E0AE62D|nr:ABC transporter substrate-binding protein [Meiothermus sp. QL-1]RDI96767.1 extracellular solute-binding protein [Meiothermus sp. QL-1]
MRAFWFSLPIALGAALAQTLTLYTSEVLPNVNPMIELFRRSNPGVNVQVFRSGTGEVLAKLRAEFEAGNPQPDLLWVADETYFRELAAANRLRRLRLTTPGYPARFAYQGGLYYEVRLLYNCIAVNTRRLANLPEPEYWRDLLKPIYKDLIGMPNPNFSGAALSTLGTFTQRFGFGFFEQLQRNGMRIEQSNPVLQQKLAEGQYGLAIIVDYGIRELIRQGAPLKVIYPRDGAILVPTPIGVLSTSKNPALAERFVRFLLSPEAQALFAQQGYVPVVASAPRPAGVSGEILAIPSDADYIQANRQALFNQFNALFNLR